MSRRKQIEPSLPLEFRELYQFDSDNGCWISKDGAREFAYSDGDEVERRIYETVRSADDLSSVSAELAKHITDWPSKYHLSALRGNLLRPFRRGLRGKILEIGAGCGAITRFLGECGGDIVAVEGSQVRATIAADRCRNLRNVKVIADAVHRLPPSPTYDVVTLVGVLEYARKYFPSEGGDQVNALIRHAREFLKPEGVLIVAIENQLGLKYFAGCGEDHVGVPMFGIEDRYGAEGVVTFGRRELREALSRSGLPVQRWWYPFPDYKLPTVVVSEKALSGFLGTKLHEVVGASLEIDPQLPQSPLFMLERAWRPVVRNGLGPDLANSFLVIAGMHENAITLDGVGDAYHFAVERKPEYAKAVVFKASPDEKIMVQHELLYPESRVSDSVPIEMTLDQGEEFVEGQLWSQKLKSILKTEGWRLSELVEWARHWYIEFLNEAELNENLEKLTASISVPGSLIDAIPRNLIFRPNGGAVFIDKEWSVTFPLELGYIVFRGLYLILFDVGRIACPEPNVPIKRIDLFREVVQSLGLLITDMDLVRYLTLESDFQRWVTGKGIGDLSSILLSNLEIFPSKKGNHKTGEYHAESIKPESTSLVRVVKRSHETIINTLLAKGKTADGIFALEKLIDSFPKYAPAYNHLGMLYSEVGEYEKAFHAYTRATILDPENSLFRKNLADFCYVKLKSMAQEPSAERMSVTEKPCDILIPIYNAYDHLAHCVNSVIRHTTGDHPIYLLDDCSTDPRVLPLLKSYQKKDPRIRVIESRENKGFVHNVNRGFNLSSNDVVILNSDTEVTEGWLEKMVSCLHSRADTGIVCPLSNNATILSVPLMNQSNSLPREMDPNQFSALVASASAREYPEIPTGVGFCMLISRDTLNQVGMFDPAFGLGYGEENDFCLRARAAGKKIVCCDDAYVHHYGEASFSHIEGIHETRRHNETLLDQKWPDYKNEIYRFCCINPLREIQERIRTKITALKKQNMPAVLYVIHNFDALGGTELHTRELIDGLSSRFRSTVFYPARIPKQWTDLSSRDEGDHLRLVKLRKENMAVNDYFLSEAGDLTSSYVETTFTKFLRGGDYSIVHFQHLAGLNSLLLPLIAKSSGKKVVLSLHDYYLLCPEYNLITPNLKRCQKNSADGNDAECLYCLGTKRKFRGGGKPVLLQDYLIGRSHLIRRVIEAVDMLIAPSSFVRRRFIQAFGDSIKDKISVVPHGISFLQKSPRIELKNELRVGFLGNASERKGILTLVESAAILKGKPIRFEIFGRIPPSLSSVLHNLGIIEHGSYQRRDLPRLLARTHLVVIPSVCDETFCMAASESLMMGIPVLASRCGGLSEKIIDGQTGFLVHPGDAVALAAKLVDILDNPGLLEDATRTLRNYRIKNIKENCEDYAVIYSNLMGFKPETHLLTQSLAVEKAFNDNCTSIVIPIFNELKYTQECVESIRKHTPEMHEIIFVDNGSSDGSSKWLNKLIKSNSHYKLIENKKNLGFSKGCNQGIEAATGEYVLLLNNDVVVTENWLCGMLECLTSAPHIGIVGPMTNNVSGPQKVPVVGYSSIDELTDYARVFRKKNRHRWIPKRRVVGFCMLFKRQLIEEIGFLDERFGPGNFEDDDLCLRASLAGYHNVIAGDVFIHHYGSRSFIGNRIDYGSSLCGNRKVFADKWSGMDAVQRFGKKLSISNAIVRADELCRKGDIEKATASMLEAIQKTPDDRNLYSILVGMLIDAKRYADALGILESLPQGNADARQLTLIGYCEEGLGHEAEAEEYADRALALDGSMAQALNIKGVVAYKKGEKDYAESLFKRAIESVPSLGESYTNLGSLKWDTGEPTEALNLFERGFILSSTVADVATAYHAAVSGSGCFARAEPVFREARALHPNDKRIAFLLIAILIQQEKHDLAMHEIEQAMIQFGIDDGILSAGLDIRRKIGSLEIDRSKKDKATLSLCMIVKNEEAHLAKCLMSVKPMVNEIIVVDTGSNDLTQNIAATLGAKVFDYPWTNDFSEARNYSVSKAAGDWILVLDADEVVSHLDHGRLSKITKQRPEKPVAYTMITRNYTNNAGSRGWVANEGQYAGEEAGKGWVPSPKVRLFVNDKRIKFVNPVHELVEPTLKKVGIKIKACDVPIHHYGRLNKDKVIAKGKEYYLLGKKKIEETQGDYNALKELAIQASEIGEYEEAVKVWQKVVEIQPKDAVAHMNRGFAF